MTPMSGELLSATIALWARWQCTTCGPNTIRQRADIVERLREHSGTDPRLADVDAVAAFLARPNLNPNSRATYFRALSAWFEWLHRTGRIPADPIVELRKPRGRQGIPDPLTAAEVAAVFGPGVRQDVRSMMSLALYAGLRCSEVARFRGDQIRDRQLIVTGKGDKPARLPLADELAELAGLYPQIGYWFPSPWHRRDHMVSENVSRVVAERFRAVGVAHGSIHRLRHTYGTLVHRHCKDLRVTQQMLRHSNPNTTQVYTMVENEDMAGALRGLPRLSA